MPVHQHTTKKPNLDQIYDEPDSESDSEPAFWGEANGEEAYEIEEIIGIKRERQVYWSHSFIIPLIPHLIEWYAWEVKWKGIKDFMD